jgi:hypothetical protein
MITAILSIIAAILPYVLELFSKEAKVQRGNSEFDKAIAENDVDSISRMLSERYDSVRKKNSSDS